MKVVGRTWCESKLHHQISLFHQQSDRKIPHTDDLKTQNIHPNNRSFVLS